MRSLIEFWNKFICWLTGRCTECGLQDEEHTIDCPNRPGPLDSFSRWA